MSYLSRVAADVYSHQAASALEPNSLLMSKLPEPIQWMIRAAGKSALRRASRRLAIDFKRIGLSHPPLLDQWQ